MLRYLTIRNIVLIDRAEIEFSAGLNVITGETGAGKSIVLSALGLLLGDRANTDLIGSNGSEAVIEATFEFSSDSPAQELVDSVLNVAGLTREDELLLLRRTVSCDGRSRIFINNSPALVRILKDLGHILVDLHGQHEHQSLLRRATYRSVVNRFGVKPSLTSAYAEMYARWQDCRDRLAALQGDERERRRREDHLRFQIKELEAAHLVPNEEKEMDRELHILQYAEQLSERALQVYRALYEGEEESPALLDRLGQLHHVVHEMSLMDDNLKKMHEAWENPLAELEDMARELRSYVQQIEFDPNRLEELHNRKHLLQKLKAKYGDSVEEMLKYLESAGSELAQIENLDADIERAQKELEEVEQRIGNLVGKLLRERRRVGARLSKAIVKELAHLGMKGSRFNVAVEPHLDPNGVAAGSVGHVRLGPGGCDEIDFLLSTIPDRPLRPLREVASGGEVSRIMLALKYVLGKAHTVPTMIFDEIDLGIGGRTAETVAERLQNLSKEKQVICITHLPQIAARAPRNLRVTKSEARGVQKADVEHLVGKAREDELVRMLGGDETSRRYARELLRGSKERKK